MTKRVVNSFPSYDVVLLKATQSKISILPRRDICHCYFILRLLVSTYITLNTREYQLVIKRVESTVEVDFTWNSTTMQGRPRMNEGPTLRCPCADTVSLPPLSETAKDEPENMDGLCYFEYRKYSRKLFFYLRSRVQKFPA